MTAPLAGRRFVVTRRPEQAGGLVAQLRAAGAEVVEVPAIAIAPPEDASALDAALAGLDRYDWIVFTSANAVQAVAGRPLQPDRWPRLASVGPATSRAIEQALGRGPDLVPESDFRAEGLAAAFAGAGVAGRRVFLPVSDRARDTLEAALRACGAEVTRVVAYRTVAPPEALGTLQAALAVGVDLILFASPSAAENVALLLGPGARLPACAVIGPVTEAAARGAGFDVEVVAAPSTAEGLVACLVRRFARG